MAAETSNQTKAEEEQTVADTKESIERFHALRNTKLCKLKWTPSPSENVAEGYECLDYPHKSSATPSQCSRTCRACFNQYLPLHWQKNFDILQYTEKCNDGEASSIVERLTNETRSNLASIHQLLDTYGNAVIKRWQKRNPPKRSALLLEAMPTMYRTRMSGPDFDKPCSEPRQATRSPMLLPWLNIELMSEEPLNLLALLHHRTSAHPSDWVMFDSEAIKAAFTRGALEVSYNPHCVTLYGDDRTFGRLVPWELRAAHQWNIVGFPRAKLILEAQRSLSSFLLKMLDLLLQGDKAGVQKGNEKWQELVAAEFKQRDAAERASSYRSAPFRAAPKLDLDRIVEKLETRLQASLDETWLLQTDPAYTRQILAAMENSASYLHGDKSQQTSKLLAPLFASISSPGYWQVMTEEATLARDICKINNFTPTTCTAGEDISEACADALRVLEYALSSEFGYLNIKIRDLAVRFGVLDKVWRFDKSDRPIAKNRAADKEPIYWCLDKFYAHDSLDFQNPGQFLEALDHFCHTAAGNKVNQVITECLSDMCTLDEAIMSLRHSRPRHGPELDFMTFSDSVEGRAHWNDWMFKTFLSIHWEQYIDILRPELEEFLNAPVVGEKLTRKTIDSFDAGHAALNDLWAQVGVVRQSILTMEACVYAKESDLVDICRAGDTKEYKRERAQERRALLNEVVKKEAEREARNRRTKAKQQTSSPVPVTPVQTIWGKEDTTPTFSRSKAVSKKEKVRKDSVLQDSLPPDDGKLANVTRAMKDYDINHESVPVSGFTMGILTRMFVSYGKHNHGNVRWEHFVAAMADAGAIASQSAGSAVTFTETRGRKRSIVFHQPHPDHSINPIMLRSFGKRLKKNFGWDVWVFVQRD